MVTINSGDNEVLKDGKEKKHNTTFDTLYRDMVQSITLNQVE